MLGLFRLLVIAIGSVLVLVSPAIAALDSVSGRQNGNLLTSIGIGGEPTQVAYSLANGFPIWYSDGTTVVSPDGPIPLKLQLCLDQTVQILGGGTFFPCFLEANPNAPVSFPNNFGPEAFWWAATAATTFTSSDGSLNSMAFTAGQEAAFGLGFGAFDGDQIAFNRIRLRITVPVPGIYRVTHPYGTFDYHVTAAGLRAINQTQDVGNLPPEAAGPPPSGNFTLALNDGVAPPEGFDPLAVDPLADPLAHDGVVDFLGKGIGPFLIVAVEPGGAPLPLVESVTGDLYLSDPGDVIHNELPITRGPVANTFSLELISLLPLVPDPVNEGEFLLVDPASVDFFLNGPEESQLVVVTDFQIMGKLFRDLPNQAPVAVDDFVGVRKGQSVDIDVVANDLMDGRNAFQPGVNEYTINPQALGLPTNPDDLLAEIKLARRMDLASGAKVQRFTNISTGRSFYGYDPPSVDFTGIDSFWYVVQDHGGLISAPALVQVLVEDLTLDKAEYRPRLGKWYIEGTSSYTTDNFVNLYGGPRTQFSPMPDVTTSASGQLAMRMTEAGIDYALVVDPLPASPVTSITLRLGGPSGDALMEIFFSGVHGPFNGTLSGTLTPAQSLFPFAEVIEAINAGNAYVRVDTSSRPLGELRGQLLQSVIAENVAVMPPVGEETMGRWVFEGKSTISPGLLPHVQAESRYKVLSPGRSLRFR
jgi:hypothetical protein